jgi:hypothetical protein
MGQIGVPFLSSSYSWTAPANGCRIFTRPLGEFASAETPKSGPL